MTQPEQIEIDSSASVQRPITGSDYALGLSLTGDIDDATSLDTWDAVVGRFVPKATTEQVEAAGGTSADTDDLDDTGFVTSQGLREMLGAAASPRFTDIVDSEVDAAALAENPTTTWPKTKLPTDTVYTDTQRFTDADRTKLDGIERGATAGGGGGPTSGRTQAQVEADIDRLTEPAALKANTATRWTAAKLPADTVFGGVPFTQADHDKLDGIETGATADQTAAEVTVVTSGFTKNLASDDDTVQKVANKVDALALGTTSTGTDDQTAAEVPVTATGFSGNLATTDDNVQKVADKVDALDTGVDAFIADGTLTAQQQVTVRTQIDAASADLFRTHPVAAATYRITAAQGSIQTQGFVGYSRTAPPAGSVSVTQAYVTNGRTYTLENLLYYPSQANDLVLALSATGAVVGDFEGLSLRIGGHVFAISDGTQPARLPADRVQWTWNGVGSAFMRPGQSYDVELTRSLASSLVPPTGLKVGSIDTSSSDSRPAAWRTAIGAASTADGLDQSAVDTRITTLRPNAFTTAEQTKLAGIETGATADQTGAEMVTALSGLTGNARLPATAVRDLPTGGGGAADELEPTDTLPSAASSDEGLIVNHDGVLRVNAESGDAHVARFLAGRDPQDTTSWGYWDFAALDANDYGEAIGDSPRVRFKTGSGTYTSPANSVLQIRIAKTVMATKQSGTIYGRAHFGNFWGDFEATGFATLDTTNYWGFSSTDGRFEVPNADDEVDIAFYSDALRSVPLTVKSADAWVPVVKPIQHDDSLTGTGDHDAVFSVASGIRYTDAKVDARVGGFARANSPTGRIPYVNSRLWRGTQTELDALVAARTIETDVFYVVTG